MIIVFGSAVMDVGMRVPRVPARGETMITQDAWLSPGGKGANQANAAARFGGSSMFVGAVGDDALAEPTLALLAGSGVDLSAVRRVPGVMTGCAAVWIDAEGGNTIVGASGANWHVRHSDVSDAALARARALIMQNEVPGDENWQLAERARRHGVRIIYNNAPAGPLPVAAAVGIGILVVNEIEAVQTATWLGFVGRDPLAAGSAIAERYGITVIVTLGADGSTAFGPDGAIHVPASPVAVVDTTGAGDTYVGVLAAALAETDDLARAMRLASAAASLACTRPGTQAAQPGRDEIMSAAAGL